MRPPSARGFERVCGGRCERESIGRRRPRQLATRVVRMRRCVQRLHSEAQLSRNMQSLQPATSGVHWRPPALPPRSPACGWRPLEETAPGNFAVHKPFELTGTAESARRTSSASRSLDNRYRGVVSERGLQSLTCPIWAACWISRTRRSTPTRVRASWAMARRTRTEPARCESHDERAPARCRAFVAAPREAPPAAPAHPAPPPLHVVGGVTARS